MERRRIRELRGKAQSLAATVHVGKEGMTDRVADELRTQLEKNKLVKVKVLLSSNLPPEEAARRLADSSRAVLVEVRGRTVVLARE